MPRASERPPPKRRDRWLRIGAELFALFLLALVIFLLSSPSWACR